MSAYIVEVNHCTSVVNALVNAHNPSCVCCIPNILPYTYIHTLYMYYRLAESVNKLLGSMEVQDHHVEHQLAAVQDHIKNLIGKIQSREDVSESRIENLEALVKKVIVAIVATAHAILLVQLLR